MVTMDSDSASQDSDEGRRFRFEATRKDSNSRLDSGRERPSSPRRQSGSSSRRRSRSREQQHRSDDRHRESREDASRSRLRPRRRWPESRDRSGGPRENSKYSRSRERASNRDASPKCDRRDSRGRENKRHHERSSQERKKETSEKREKFRESGRSSRDANSQNRTRDGRGNSRRKNSKNDEPEGKSAEKRDSWDRKEPARNCENLNLSDFDVVSDTEEHSSDASPTRRRGLVGDSLKKRVSRQHYERLVKRQETLRRRRGRDESTSPRVRNGSDAPTSGGARDEASRKSPETSAPSVRSDSPIDKAENLEARDPHWGPALPPNSHDETIPRDEEKSSARIVGPKLPENFRTSDREEDDAFGPALPPHLSSSDDSSKPKQTRLVSDGERIEDDGEEEPTSGSDEDDLVGPLPIDHPAMESDAVQQRLEMRARRLKAELAACDKEDEKKREEWMMELPPVKGPSLGLAPRKFRTRAAPDMSDRSSWTDTPADRARKRMEKLENKNVCEPAMRNEEGSRGASVEVEKSRKREKSLLEIHQKRLHKKKKKEEKEAKRNGKKPERRPFDRDIDLQANRFDEAQKKRMFLKTAANLDDRFSRGNI